MSDVSGFGLVLLDQVFEAGRLGEGVEPSMISTVFFTLNVVCTLVVCGVIVTRTLSTVLNVASSKNAEADGMSLTWAPLHLCMSVALVFPMTSTGYSPGQYLAMWVAEKGSQIGDIALGRTLDYLEGGGTITAPPMPSINGLGVALLESEFCRAEANAMIQMVEATYGQTEIARVTPVVSQPDAATFQIAYPIQTNLPVHRLPASWRREDRAPYCGAVSITAGELPEVTPTDTGLPPPPNRDSPLAMAAAARYKTDAMDEAARAFNVGAMAAIAGAMGAARAEIERIATEGLAYDAQYWHAADTSEESALIMDDVQLAERLQLRNSAAAMVPVLRTMRTDVFQVYGDLVQEFDIARDQDGASWVDQLRSQGWPALGMFWVQMVAQNQQLLKRASVGVTATPPAWQRLFDASGGQSRQVVVGQRLGDFRILVQSEMARTGLGSTLDTSGRVQSAQQVKDLMADELTNIFSMAKGDGLEPATAGENIKAWLSGLGKGLLTWTVQEMREGEANPITVLVNTGHTFVVVSEAFYVLQVMATAGLDQITSSGGGGGGNLATKAINFLFSGTNFIGNILKQVLEDLAGVWKYVALGAMFAAFYVAVMPFVIYFMAVISWLIHVVQAVAVVSVWGMLYAFEMGSTSFAPQRIQQGYLHLLELLLMPIFIVIGFFIALKIVDVSGFFLIDWLLVAIMSGAGDNMFGLMSIVAGLVIIAVLIFQIMARILEASMTLHEKAMAWLGQASTMGAETDRASRTTVVGAVSSGGGAVNSAGRTQAAGQDLKRETRNDNKASRISRK